MRLRVQSLSAASHVVNHCKTTYSVTLIGLDAQCQQNNTGLDRINRGREELFAYLY